jgi:hypothetical protein
VHHEVVVAFRRVFDIIHFVLFVIVHKLRIRGWKAGVNVLRCRLVLGCATAFQVRHVRFFRWPVLIEGSADEVGTVRKFRTWLMDVDWLRSLAPD